MTMGIVEVASLAARVAAGPAVTMMSTLRRTSSAASAGRRSSLPSADRLSMTMFFPSTYPSSRRPWRNASVRAVLAEGEPGLRRPIRGIFVGCCASARWTEARAKPTSKTTMALVPIPPCLLRFIAGCPEHFFVLKAGRTRMSSSRHAGYVSSASRIADRRMILAGYRLADLLTRVMQNFD